MAKIASVPEVKRAITATFNKVKKQAKELMYNSSTDYMQLVMKNITNEKYADASWQYSPAYKEWKNIEAPDKPYWKLSDDLFNAISNKGTVGINRFVGIPSEATNKKGQKIAKYALQMEFGVKGKQPDRPVFGPSLDEYFNNGFQKRIDSTILEIIGQWRA